MFVRTHQHHHGTVRGHPAPLLRAGLFLLLALGIAACQSDTSSDSSSDSSADSSGTSGDSSAGDSGSSDGGSGDTFTLTLDGSTTTYEESGSDPQITATTASDLTTVIVASGADDRSFQVVYPEGETGSIPFGLSADTASASLIEGTLDTYVALDTGTLEITGTQDSGSTVAGSFAGVTLQPAGSPTATPIVASGEFDVAIE